VTDKQLDAAASPSALIELDLNLLIWFYYNTFLLKRKNLLSVLKHSQLQNIGHVSSAVHGLNGWWQRGSGNFESAHLGGSSIRTSCLPARRGSALTSAPMNPHHLNCNNRHNSIAITSQQHGRNTKEIPMN